MTGKPMESTVPVVIIGGGPVGLALARELDFHGVDSVVIEPRETVSHSRPRAKTTSARTMELFRRWDLAKGLRERAPLAVEWSSDIVFCTAVTGREISRFTGTLGLDLVDSDLSAEPGQQITQPLVEEILREADAAAPHVTLRLGWHAVAIDEREDGSSVTIENEAGQQDVLEARFVVGADGPRSLVRRSIGAEYEGAPAGRPNLNIVFRSRELRGLIPHGPALHYWVLNHLAPGVIGPLDLDDLWWAISTGRPEDDADNDPVAIIRALAGADIDVEIVETDPWQARSLISNSYGRGHTFLVGDAAHQNPPWGGHGFNTGIGDAVNLGWKLAAVLGGWAPGELLDSYESERRGVSELTIRVAAQNTNTLPSDFNVPELLGTEEEFLVARDQVHARVQDAKRFEFFCMGLVLGYGYTEDAASQTTDMTDYLPVAAAGNRLPHSWIAPGLSIYDLLGREFTIIGTNAASSALHDEFARRGVPVTLLTDPRVDTDALFAADVVLVRPDQHIAWLGAPPLAHDSREIVDDALRGFPALHLTPTPTK
ncbi:MAG TPA: FAD-dependent monooxygenase [Galbitalea sp.]